MAAPRIYVNTRLHTGIEIILDTAAANHLINVLRLKQGAPVIFFNGEGGEYCGVLSTVTKKTVGVTLESFDGKDNESPLRVHLGQVIGKGERMDYALQKSVELGVAEITPVISERCEVRLKGERLIKKVAHWQRIVNSACEQCQRNRIPRVNSPQLLSEWLALREETVRWICHPGISSSLSPMDPALSPASAAVLIGPEGGFSDTEFVLATAQGFEGKLFGTRVLRTETAPVVALTLLQSQWGDLP